MVANTPSTCALAEDHQPGGVSPELGGVVLIATRDANGVISLRGGDEYWWDGYPPIIHAREKSAASPAPAKPVFAGSFFEKDVAVRGLQGGAYSRRVITVEAWSRQALEAGPVAIPVPNEARALGVSIPDVEVHGGVLRFVDAAEPAEG